ncbi:MAG: TonB-dependent receptor [Bryobacterales bacterium]|nr:TonB-dependent receptor [Bryobacterales bacterium]
MRIFVLALCLAALAAAQTPTAQVTGRVTDQSEAVIPGAEILILGVDTGFERRALSNETGYFTVTLLPPGNYRLSVRRDGFRATTRTGLRLVVGQVARLDFVLEVGEVAESVEVTAAAPTVESGTAALGTVVSSKQILDMPLNSRNPLRLAYLVPGFTPSSSFSDQFNRASSFRINGGRANMNDLFLDGVSNSPPASNGFLSYAAFPSPDALQEFKVQTNSYAAEYGRTNGGVLNMVMRSGTNQFHGVFYEFLRNSKLDANNFFANRAGARLPSFKRNQFGVAGGGPIVRNKAFFFANYEGLRQRQASTFTGTFPTRIERQGDFSQSGKRVGAPCLPAQIFDPFSTRANPAGGFLRDAFPGARVPASRFDPVGAKVTEFFPLPNQPGDACSGVNNYFAQASDPLDVNQLDTKLDWNASERNRMFGGVSYRRSVRTEPNFYRNIAFTGFQTNGYEIPSWNGRLDYTRVQSPSLVLNIRAGFTTVKQDAPPPVAQDFSYANLGMPRSIEAQTRRPIGFPVFNVAGYNQLGQVFSSPLEVFQTYSLAASATVVKGRHTVKFGLDQRLNQVGSNLKQNTNGNYQFNRGFTQGPNPNVAAANLGDGLASLLLGTGGSGFVQIEPSVFTSNMYTGLYLQDDFKLARNLTLNIGLRYDLEGGKHDRFNQLTWFDYDVPSPIAQAAGIPSLRGGVRFQGVDGDSHYPTDRNNFGPRIGLAYSLGSKTALRAGYGIFYPPYVGMAGNARGSEGFSTQSPWVTSIDGVRPENLISNPFPQGLTLPTGNRLGLLTNIGQNQTDSIDRVSIRSSYAQQWNVNLQRELPGRIAAEAAYVGNKGTKLTDAGWEMNQLRPEFLSLGAGLQQRVPNPFFGLIRSGAFAGAEVTRGQMLRQFPQYGNVTNFRPTSSSSSYHALQLRVQKDFTEGATFLLSYTAGKLIDDSVGVGAGGLDSAHQDTFNRRAERAVSPQDISQRLVFSYLYDLPFGKKRRWGGAWPAGVSHLLGGWQVNGIATIATGVALPITAPNSSGAFSSVLRPNVSGNPAQPGGRSTTDRLAQWFNTAVFSQPAPFTFGNGPRTLPNVRAPGERNLDFSLFKEFPFGEARRLEFRAEFFNLTNTPNFGLPGLGFGAGNFGVIGSQANNPRQVQFGLKLYL